MEIKQAKPGSVAARKGLGLADKQIDTLKSRFLPYEPHLLNVSTDDPFRNPYYHEYEKLPFEPNEVKQLQYMTMISDGDRGVAFAKGDWHDEIYNQSPGSADARSSTTTPNPAKELKKVANKMSFSDYKNLKEKGIKPSPRPVVADAERKPGHSRNTSAVTAGTPMSRMSSLEGLVQVKQNGASASVNSISAEKMPSKETEKPIVAQNSTGAQEKAGATTNGHVEPANNTLHVKNANKNPQPQKPTQYQPNNGQAKHGLPPRPQSPPRKNPDVKQQAEPKQQKRALESGDLAQPEKRTKIEHSRTPSNSLLTRKPPTGKLLPGKLHKPQHPSPQPKKETPTHKPNHASKPSSEKPLDLPPLLSPLPADLDSSPGIKSQPAAGFANSKKSESGKNSSQSTPSKFKVGPDTIVVKKPTQLDSSPLSPPPKSPLQPLPTLLSPTLPHIVEEELVRLQQKSAEKAEKSAALNTAEARYEKARQPDTPGVARKTITPKVGHPPKKSQGESSKSKVHADRMEPKLIVKLKYKKRRANDIQRILGVRPRPDKQFLQLEKERLSGNKEPATKAPDSEEDDDDVPLSKIASKPTAAPAVSKKRTSDSFDSRSSEPAAKRPKILDSIEVSKSRATLDPPFKSPALTGPGPKNLLSTPKKGDAMKSAAMRRVDSNDGLSRTPHTSTSTPASAEKPRVNGDVRPNPEHDRLRAEEKRLSDIALKLKRKMDEYLKTKGGDRDAVTDQEKKLGLCYGLESLVTYMNAWVTQEKISKHPNSKSWTDGVQLWHFVNAHTKPYPVLSALTAQVGGLFREEVNKIYTDTLKEKRGDAQFVGLFVVNSKERDRCWSNANSGRGTLGELGVDHLLGPWSGAGEAMAYAVDVLERYSRKEKLGYKRDAGV